MSALSTAEHHINVPATAGGADQPLAPLENGRVGTVAGSHLAGVGLHLPDAFLAPNDEPDPGRCGYAKRHRGTAIGLQVRTGGRNSKNDKGTFPLSV